MPRGRASLPIGRPATNQAPTMSSEQSAAERAMSDIVANLEKWFEGDQSEPVTIAAICQVTGRYKMECGK